MQFLQKNKTVFLILGIVLILIVVIGYAVYRKLFKGLLQPSASSGSHAYALISEFPAISATTTDLIKSQLEEAFAQQQLVVILDSENDRTGDHVVLAAPSRSKIVDSVGDCGLQENPYCGLYVKRADGETKLVVFGSKLAGFSRVERFVDKDHIQFLTTWSLLNFTSTDRKQLNLENGEMLPLLITETDQDDRSASMNVSGHGDVLTLEMEGTSVNTRLSPEQVRLVDPSHKTLFTLSDEEMKTVRQAFQQDEKRMLKSIEVVPTDEDVVGNSLRIDLYGVPYKLDLRARTLTRIATNT